MRVWLVDEKSAAGTGPLEAILKQLEERSGGRLRLLGSSSFQPDFAEAMRKLVPDLLDLVVVNERAWPEGTHTQDVLSLGVGMVIIAGIDRVEQFRALAEQHPIGFVPVSPSPDALWLALVSALAAKERGTRWKEQVAHLQQRLDDRIIIERAKGILVQRLKISEEEAYQRLRVLSRRQRRQIRDIAQSLLDTQVLFAQENNGFSGHLNTPTAAEVEHQKSQEQG
ncbi:MAG TPA: ANTAR domain-containing protein [Gemmataceae bacterium]|nr:ANTAR domain-containing protein [Gemmataceae bacterium]